jgi:hypothetical protein
VLVPSMVCQAILDGVRLRAWLDWVRGRWVADGVALARDAEQAVYGGGRSLTRGRCFNNWISGWVLRNKVSIQIKDVFYVMRVPNELQDLEQGKLTLIVEILWGVCTMKITIIHASKCQIRRRKPYACAHDRNPISSNLYLHGSIEGRGDSHCTLPSMLCKSRVLDTFFSCYPVSSR